ncbi:unnamed protein product [Phytophthora lilii]|uniref:Unnamed protein product n=1 Tax=Phytophthora lilii TaxID=2077276 RepID=A0A9W6Y0G3_9STRA|nr:unnamed protein product [Phytophthora lilii]
MTREVRFQLTHEDGSAVTSADCVNYADGAKVFRLCDAVKDKFRDSHLDRIAPSDLKVFANGAQLNPRTSLVGINETLIVVAPTRGREATTIEIPQVEWKSHLNRVLGFSLKTMIYGLSCHHLMSVIPELVDLIRS